MGANEALHIASDHQHMFVLIAGFSGTMSGLSTVSLVDPEKVIFRHIEVEHWKHSGLAERVGCSILSSGRR
jgi:hypothetical protein